MVQAQIRDGNAAKCVGIGETEILGSAGGIFSWGKQFGRAVVENYCYWPKVLQSRHEGAK